MVQSFPPRQQQQWVNGLNKTTRSPSCASDYCCINICLFVGKTIVVERVPRRTRLLVEQSQPPGRDGLVGAEGHYEYARIFYQSPVCCARTTRQRHRTQDGPDRQEKQTSPPTTQATENTPGPYTTSTRRPRHSAHPQTPPPFSHLIFLLTVKLRDLRPSPSKERDLYAPAEWQARRGGTTTKCCTALA